MTCVVALKHDGVVYMGCDSAGVAGFSLAHRADPKIYRIGPMLIGFTTSFRMGQLLGYSLSLPEHHSDISMERYMATVFVNAVRNCLKDGGFASKDKETESGGTFLVGYRGRIFCVESDYQIGERLERYDAVGCGADLALGALYIMSERLGGTTPNERVRLALSAAANFSAGVCEPFDVYELRS